MAYVRLWITLFCLWLFGNRYCPNIDQRIRCINLCYSHYMSKSGDNYIIFHFIFKTFRFRVCETFFYFILSLFSILFVFSYVWSGLIVVVGIYLNVYSRNQAAFNAKFASYATVLVGARIASRLFGSTPTRTLPV